MKKAFLVLAGLLATGIIIVLIMAMNQPRTFHIERSMIMKAPAEKIYPLMSDFHKGQRWSPYEKKDPAMKRAFSGAVSGTGALYEFDGNRNVGKGRLEIIEAAPPSRVVLTLDMIEPVKGRNRIVYSLAPRGAETQVTWSMEGNNSFIGRVFCVFFDMDKMIGRDFEAGLTNLKAIVEGADGPAADQANP